MNFPQGVCVELSLVSTLVLRLYSSLWLWEITSSWDNFLELRPGLLHKVMDEKYVKVQLLIV